MNTIYVLLMCVIAVCQGATYCSDPISKLPAPVMCTTTGTQPFCIKEMYDGMWTGNYTCAECDADAVVVFPLDAKPDGDCECNPGYYCRKTGLSRGTCQPKLKLGQQCTFHSPDFGMYQRNFDPKQLNNATQELFCGLGLYDESTGGLSSLEWIGICARGRCCECTTYAGAVVHTPTAICGDRICIEDRYYVHQYAWFISWGFIYSNGAVFLVALALGLFVLLWISLIVLSIMSYVNRKRLLRTIANYLFGNFTPIVQPARRRSAVRF